ncbi:MAG TPA: polysaccharide deacetylase family protein [Bacteroidota bacterium]|jgi:hypothetical protein|nr:polysaccharide deacetylase family protein [Bacteroidota bacterium]
MNYHVGICGKSPGWELLLAQEGLRCSAFSESGSGGNYCAVVVSDNFAADDGPALKKYLSGGGSILCSGRVFEKTFAGSTVSRFIRYLVDDASLSGFGLLDIFTEGKIPAGAKYARTAHGSPAVFIGEYGGGILAVLPFDPGSLVLDRRIMAKSFYTSRNRMPHETVSMVSKGALRKFVAGILEKVHHLRKIPYVHTWYYPRDGRSIFALRIDTDYGGEEEINTLYDLSNEFSTPFSWFVHVGYRPSLLQKYKDMNNHEIGVHCFDHIRYENSGVIAEDLKKAVASFESAGIHPRSFAAPYGIWNYDIARAVEQFHFEYSSEFCYDYDNLPSHTVTQHPLQALQVPIHPVSIGSLRRQGFSEQEMTGYFAEVIERKILLRDPVMLYHHPNNRHERVLREVMANIRRTSLPSMRLIDFAEWWKKRENSIPNIELRGTTLGADGASSDGDVWLHVTRGDGTECFIPPASSMDLNSAGWSARPAPLSLPEDYARVRKYNPWIAINKLEDAVTRMFRSV